ncbi:MAG TPA: hypothetical protein VM120_23560 [Bryobacteraceae bacterium]|nr:hypothetical protein [Bryobacteraceae bacterium]
MAMYTNLRLRCKLTPAVLPLVQRLRFGGYSWRDISCEPGYEYLNEVAADIYALAIRLNNWDGQRLVCSAPDLLWSFSCEVKNYSGAIDKFLLALPSMIEELYECQTQHESATLATDHYLRNGRITDINLHGYEMIDDDMSDDADERP